MEIMSFDLNNSFENMEQFKQQTNDTFIELAATAESASQIMSESILSFAEGTGLAFDTTSLQIQDSFNMTFLVMQEGFATALGGMNESAAVLCAEMVASFAQTWISISESTTAFWAGLELGFTDTWLSISESTAAFWAELELGFTTLWMNIKNGFTVLWSSVNEGTNTFHASINESSTALWAGLDAGFNVLWTRIGEGTNTSWQSTKSSADGLWAELTGGFTNLWNSIDERFNGLWSNIRGGNSSLWNDTNTESSGLISRVNNNFVSMREKVKSRNDGLWGTTKSDAGVLIGGIHDEFKQLWKDIPSGMKDMALEVCDVLNKLLSWLVSPINSIINGFNKIPFVDIPTLNPSISPPTFAQGGFPSQGQMFIAREAGPELVGSLNGRTAVVNNDQIVESVSRGVYDAVRAAMSGEKSGNSSTAEFNLYLDSKQITSSVERVQKERGLSLMGGGAVYGF